MLLLGIKTLMCQKKAYGGRVGRRGWDGEKHWSPGIPPIGENCQNVFFLSDFWVVSANTCQCV